MYEILNTIREQSRVLMAHHSIQNICAVKLQIIRTKHYERN